MSLPSPGWIGRASSREPSSIFWMPLRSPSTSVCRTPASDSISNFDGALFPRCFAFCLLAAEPVAALFYAWQLARMFLVYAAVYKRMTANPRTRVCAIKGCSGGIILEPGFALWDRFALHAIQAGGSEGHHNILGMMSHFVVFPFFALLLTRTSGLVTCRGNFNRYAVEVLTTSRATIGLAVFGYALLFLLSAIRHWTSRKFADSGLVG